MVPVKVAILMSSSSSSSSKKVNRSKGDVSKSGPQVTRD